MEVFSVSYIWRYSLSHIYEGILCLILHHPFRSLPSSSAQSLKKTQGSVWESPRAMSKLLKEAKRVKQVLSANTGHYAQVYTCTVTKILYAHTCIFVIF